MYNKTSICFGFMVFFLIGCVDKIVAQSKWDVNDLIFAAILAVLSGRTLYFYKNKL